MKWKRGSFKIAMNPKVAAWMGDDCNRQGLVSGPFGINKASTGFVITALSSGLMAGEYDRMAQAKHVAEKLAGLPIDWTVTSPLHDVPNDVRATAQMILRG